MVESSIDLLQSGLNVYESLSALADDITFGEYLLSDSNTPEYRSLIFKNIAVLKYSDRAYLSEIYVQLLEERGYKLSESDFLSSDRLRETFTYVRNSFSDEAYDVFSQDFVDPKVRYSQSFKECARALSSDEVAYCLFPLEEKGGARLPTVAEIIFRNDFKINAVIPVFGPDGNADIKYALVSRSFTIPKREKDDDCYLEIRIGAEGESSLSETLGIVNYFDMGIYRINTVTFDTEGERETYFSVVVKDRGKSFAALLTYLTLFVRDFVPVGIYKNLE